MDAEYLIKVVKIWRDEIWVGKLDRRKAWLDLNTWIMKEIENLLPVSTFMYKAC